jgi:hypothetical protein
MLCKQGTSMVFYTMKCCKNRNFNIIPVQVLSVRQELPVLQLCQPAIFMSLDSLSQLWPLGD